MSLLLRILLFVPITYLIMIAYVAPHESEARPLAKLAARKTVKVTGWVAAIVVVMELVQWLFLP